MIYLIFKKTRNKYNNNFDILIYMEKLDINLDDDFKNIDTSLNNNPTNTIGMDLLVNQKNTSSNDGGNISTVVSPKSAQGYNSDDNKSNKSDDFSFFKSGETNNADRNVPMEPMNDPIMNSVAPDEYKPVHILSQTDIKNEKIDLLYKFSKLNNQGVNTSMNYNMNSNLDDMRNEYIKLKRQREIENSVKFQRKILMAAISGAEFLNNKFDPFDIKLDGWSESVNESVGDFDEVFEQLYEKYGGGGEIAPELRLIMMLGGSAFMFHLSNTMFKSSIPNMNDIMKQNPDLMKQFAKAAVGSIGQQPQPQHQMPNMMRQDPPHHRSSPQPSRNEMEGPDGNIDDIIKNMNLQPNAMPDLDSLSIMSGDSDKNSTKGLTLNL